MLPILGCKVMSPFPFIPAVADTASHIYISRNDHLSERDTAFPTIPNIEFHFGFCKKITFLIFRCLTNLYRIIGVLFVFTKQKDFSQYLVRNFQQIYSLINMNIYPVSNKLQNFKLHKFPQCLKAFFSLKSNYSETCRIY